MVHGTSMDHLKTGQWSILKLVNGPSMYYLKNGPWMGQFFCGPWSTAIGGRQFLFLKAIVTPSYLDFFLTLPLFLFYFLSYAKLKLTLKLLNVAESSNRLSSSVTRCSTHWGLYYIVG